MKNYGLRYILLLMGFLAAAAAACGLGSDEGPPSDAVIVDVRANTSLGPWLEEAAAEFNANEF